MITEEQLTLIDHKLDEAEYAFWYENEYIMTTERYKDLLERRNKIAFTLGFDDRASNFSKDFEDGYSSTKIKHLIPNLKFDKYIYDESLQVRELLDIDKIQNLLKTAKTNAYVIEPKLDGLALTIQKESNGDVHFLLNEKSGCGDDVTYHFERDPRFAQTFKQLKPGDVIKGELVVDLNYISTHKINNVKQHLSTIMKRKQRQNLISHGIRFIAFNYYSLNSRRLTETEQLFTISDRFSLEAVNCVVRTISRDLDLTINISLAMDSKMCNNLEKSINSKINGLVVKQMKNDGPDKDGKCDGMLYLKHAAAKVLTKLRYIEYKSVRNGKITPIAHFDTVYINGIGISEASLQTLDKMSQILPHEKWKKGLLIKIDLIDGMIPYVCEVEVDISKLNQDELWEEFVNAKNHLSSLLPINGNTLSLKTYSSLKSRILTQLRVNFALDGRFKQAMIHSIYRPMTENFEFYTNSNSYLLDILKYLLDKDLSKLTIDSGFKKLIRRQRFWYSTHTLEDVLNYQKNNLLYDYMKDNNIPFTYNGLEKAIDENQRLKEQKANLLQVYKYLCQYLRSEENKQIDNTYDKISKEDIIKNLQRS